MEIVALLIGVLLGAVAIWFVAKHKFQKSNRPANEVIKTNPTVVHQPISGSATKPADQQQRQSNQEVVVRRDPNNSKYISSAKEILNEFSRDLSERVPSHIGYTIAGQHSELSDYFEKLGDNTGIDSVYHVITFSGGVEMRSEMETNIDQAMGLLFDFYQEFVDTTFAAVPDAAEIKPRFSLSADQIAQEIAKGTMALKQNLSPIFTEFMEMSRLQNQLRAQFPNLKQIVEENQNTDWGSIFKTFGGGALAAFNPFIGIPVLLANWFGESKKQKQQQQMLEEYSNNYQVYLQQWDKILNLYMPVFEKQKKYLQEKISNIVDTAIPRVLTELDKSGYSLKKVPSHYKNELIEYKQSIQSN